MRMNWFDYIVWILLIIGGLNWGLIGLFEYNLVDDIFGAASTASRVIYTIVGLAAVYMIIRLLMLLGREAENEVDRRT